MLQSLLIAPSRSELRRADDAPARPDEVLVRVMVSGICASELHGWEEPHGALPLALGHEVAGEVVATGSGVTGFAVGQRVTGLFQGGFAEFVTARADRVAAVPDKLAIEAAFGEPLACAVSAADRTKVRLGDRVAIVGLGFMGLLMGQLLRLRGPVEIVGIDLRADARDKGALLCCDRVCGRDGAEEHAEGFDVVVEATGTADGLTLAGKLVRQHGVLSILGYHQGGPRSIDMQNWNYKALEVLNAHERRDPVRMDCMRRGLALAAAGRIRTGLATHSFGLDGVDAAFSALRDKPAGFTKAVITPANTKGT
jgi:threonine dehydrogenase-like Zn-dependent dehydrogenase